MGLDRALKAAAPVTFVGNVKLALEKLAMF